MTAVIVIVVIVVVLGIIFALLYNGLVKLRNVVQESLTSGGRSTR